MRHGIGNHGWLDNTTKQMSIFCTEMSQILFNIWWKLLVKCKANTLFLWRCDSTQVMASSLLRFLDHTQRCTTVGRTPLDEWSACRRDLYLTTHNTHNRQTSITPVGFEPMISAGERPQTYTLDRAATGTGKANTIELKKGTQHNKHIKINSRNTQKECLINYPGNAELTL